MAGLGHEFIERFELARRFATEKRLIVCLSKRQCLICLFANIRMNGENWLK